MEMLVFYVIAVLLSAYETNKDKMKNEQQPEAAPEKSRKWKHQYNVQH